ncbi:MAG: ATP-binding protein, partial [Desulfobacterales bacterium]|nr:ATP-binding protein [Desulfobacterales bacterium]
MRELSLHILDVVENGITAGAHCLSIRVEESAARDRLEITIRDDGRGMPAEKIRNLSDPFVTTRTTRRVGLGLSLLAAAARRCEGDIRVNAEPGRGTEVTAVFRRSHIDRAPLGDMAATMGMLIIGNPHLDFVYIHRVDEGEFVLDTRELKAELEGLSLSDPVVVQHLTQSMRRALNELA